MVLASNVILRSLAIWWSDLIPTISELRREREGREGREREGREGGEREGGDRGEGRSNNRMWYNTPTNCGNGSGMLNLLHRIL